MIRQSGVTSSPKSEGHRSAIIGSDMRCQSRGERSLERRSALLDFIFYLFLFVYYSFLFFSPPVVPLFLCLFCVYGVLSKMHTLGRTLALSYPEPNCTLIR